MSDRVFGGIVNNKRPEELPKPAEEGWLVTWVEDIDDKRVDVPETKVRECLSNLVAAGVAPNTIKVWRPVRVKLTVELG